jgi:glycosyltransferase involved in cell wall biosynthesis
VQRFGLGEVFVNARAEEMSSAIMKLLEVPGYLHACKMASRRAAEEVFFWEKEEKRLLELYSCL